LLNGLKTFGRIFGVYTTFREPELLRVNGFEIEEGHERKNEDIQSKDKSTVTVK
jgi:hypothetical protein